MEKFKGFISQKFKKGKSPLKDNDNCIQNIYILLKKSKLDGLVCIAVIKYKILLNWQFDTCGEVNEHLQMHM